MEVYVMVLAFFLKGGLVMTKSFSTPNKQVCEDIKPLMVRDYMQGKIHLGNTDLPILHITPACIKLTYVSSKV